MTGNVQTEARDQEAIAIAQELLHKTPSRLHKYHSGRHYCVAIEFDDNTADRVIKLTNGYRWAIEVERYLFPEMSARGLPVPEIEFTHKDYSRPSEPFLVMPKYSDHTLSDIDNVNEAASERACEASGRFLHEFHERFAAVFPPFREIEDLRGQLAATQRLYDEPMEYDGLRTSEPEMAAQVDDRLRDFVKPDARQISHGAYYTQNVLADEQGKICVIDLGESIKMASSLMDLCTLLTGSSPRGTNRATQCAAMIRGYGGLDDSDLVELRNWELYTCVWALRTLSQPYSDFTQGIVNRLRSVLAGTSPLQRQLESL
jgi:hypothetical protein